MLMTSFFGGGTAAAIPSSVSPPSGSAIVPHLFIRSGWVGERKLRIIKRNRCSGYLRCLRFSKAIDVTEGRNRAGVTCNTWDQSE